MFCFLVGRVSVVSFSLCYCHSGVEVSLVFSQCFLFLCFISLLCNVKFCGCPELCKKARLIEKVFFLLIVCYLAYLFSFSHPLLFCFLKLSFLCCEFATKQQWLIVFLFSHFNLYALQFPGSIYHLAQSFIYFCLY